MAYPQGAGRDSLADQLRQLVNTLAASGRSALPGSTDALLHSIVEAAASIFGAGAASILLLDEGEGVLEFKVAHGAAEHDLTGTRIPIDQGIAGYVAMTGQPIAISDVEHDARFNREFARSTGYVPRSILATPLKSGDRILGVMEILDKIDARSFGMHDMELLGMFAQQAALAIDQAQLIEHLDEALVQSLKQLTSSDPEHPSEDLLVALDKRPDANYLDDLSTLADLYNEFCQLGEDERKTCLKILTAFAEYGRSRQQISKITNRR
jgi:GAF domain-containing protein